MIKEPHPGRSQEEVNMRSNSRITTIFLLVVILMLVPAMNIRGANDIPVTPPGDGTNDPPTANFDFTYPAYLGNAVFFTDTSTDPDGNIVYWKWTFGDGDTSFLQNPSHVYTYRNEYAVTLKVTDNNGATDTITKTVPVFATSDSGRHGVVGEIHDTNGMITISPNTDRMIFWPDGSGYVDAVWELRIADDYLSGTFRSSLIASLQGSVEDITIHEEPYTGITPKTEGTLSCYLTISYWGLRFAVEGSMEGKDIAPDGTTRNSADGTGYSYVWKPLLPGS